MKTFEILPISPPPPPRLVFTVVGQLDPHDLCAWVLASLDGTHMRSALPEASAFQLRGRTTRIYDFTRDSFKSTPTDCDPTLVGYKARQSQRGMWHFNGMCACARLAGIDWTTPARSGADSPRTGTCLESKSCDFAKTQQQEQLTHIIFCPGSPRYCLAGFRGIARVICYRSSS